MATPGDDVSQWGVLEFEERRFCPSGCKDPVFEVEVLEGLSYDVLPSGGWELRDHTPVTMAILLYARCTECGHVLIDRKLEEALAVELACSKADRSARREKTGPPRRRFALHKYKERADVTND